jgi:tetratricopeptide (TPR) repeat protein
LLAAICGDDAASVNRRGNREYNEARYGEAVETYRTAQAMAPERSEPRYNAGNALNRSGEYAAAIDETKRALPAEDDDVAADSEYALGNHYVGASRIIDAIEAYKRALIRRPDDADAKHNLEVLTRQLDATPSPSPTLVPPTPPPGTPPADGEPGDGGGEDEATPEPGGEPTAGATASAGTPGATPPPADDLSDAEIERLLAEALEGIDEEFTVEEALQVLDLLEEQNRNQLDEGGTGGRPGAPDY